MTGKIPFASDAGGFFFGEEGQQQKEFGKNGAAAWA